MRNCPASGSRAYGNFVRSPWDLDRRAARGARLQAVGEIVTGRLAQARRQIAADRPDARLVENRLHVERAAAVTRVRVVAARAHLRVRVREAEFCHVDAERLVRVAGLAMIGDRPVRRPEEPRKRQMRIVEHAGHRDGGVHRVELHPAVLFVRVDVAPQVLDARQAGARVIARGEARRRLLRGDADALQIALEAVMDDRLHRAAALLGGGLVRLGARALHSEVVVRDEPARIEAHQLVQHARRQRQRAHELREDAEIDPVAAHREQLPVLHRVLPEARFERRQRQHARELRAVRQRRLSEFRAKVAELQREVAGRHVRAPVEVSDGQVELRLRRAHAQADAGAVERAARRLDAAVREMRPDRVVDAAGIGRDRQVHVARERRQIDRSGGQIRVAVPVDRLAGLRKARVFEVGAEVERAMEQRALARRLQCEAVVVAVVQDREADVVQHELRHVAGRVEPAQRAAAEHDRLLAQQPGGERRVAAVRARHLHAGHRERAVVLALDQHVRAVDDQARQQRRQLDKRAPCDGRGRMRHVERDLAVTVANRQTGDVDAGLKPGPVRREPVDAQLRMQPVRQDRLDARTKQIDARQHDITQPKQQCGDDEPDDERDRERDAQRMPKHDMVACGRLRCPVAGLSVSMRTGGVFSLGHAAAGGVW
jgi:hypothetical protein